jgi:hypothetical protein
MMATPRADSASPPSAMPEPAWQASAVQVLLRGVIPVAPTVSRDGETLDLAGQARVVDVLELARGLRPFVPDRRA